MEWNTGDEIGERGGYGKVYKTRKEVEGIIQPGEFAKKILMLDDMDAVERFKKEVRLTKRLNHPNVVDIIDENLNLEPLFYIMKLYNFSMSKVIGELKSDYDRLRNIFNSIFDGVEYLHNQGVLHRDLKPGNILMNNNDELVIADLGLGVQTNSESERLTATGIGMGTRFYTAPEQITDFKNVNERADVYSLGCILYESVAEDFTYQLDYSKIPPSFEHVIRKATEQSFEKRYDSIDNLRKAFNFAIGIIKDEYDENFGKGIIAKLNSGTDDSNFMDKAIRYIYDNIGDVDYIHDVIMNINQNQFKIIEEHFLELTKKIIRQFKISVTNQSWGFGYVDTIGSQCNRLISIASSKDIISDLIITIVQVGSRHNRWDVMDLARTILYSIDDTSLSVMLVEELEEYRWEINHLKMNIRELKGPLKSLVSQQDL